MSYKIGATDRIGDECVFNAVRVATLAEATDYAADLYSRWTACRQTIVRECTDPVTHVFVEGQIRRIDADLVATVAKVEAILEEGDRARRSTFVDDRVERLDAYLAAEEPGGIYDR